MSNHATVSVVIPCYNGAHFLSKAIDSVLTQTVAVDEILVVDDGSTDNTREVAVSYGNRVTYIFQKNKGLAGARNTGIKAAKSDWVALLDADDWWMPDKIELQKRVVSDDTVLVYTGVWFVNSDGSSTQCPAASPNTLWPALRTRNLITPSTVMIRKVSLTEIGGFNESIRACEDWDMWVRLIPKGEFKAVVEPVTGYRVVSGSLSSDPYRMLNTFYAILDGTLLQGLKGLERELWRRRAVSTQLYSAALIAREANRRKDELHLMAKSLAVWPSIFWQASRYRSFLFSLKRFLIQ